MVRKRKEIMFGPGRMGERVRVRGLKLGISQYAGTALGNDYDEFQASSLEYRLGSRV